MVWLFQFIVCFLISAHQGEASRPPIESFIPAFEQYVDEVMNEWQAPAIAVAIVKDGQIIHVKAYGVKEQGKKEPVTVNSVFPIVSLTKNITALLVAKLVDEGILAWDDPVQKYFPEFALHDSSVAARFTIRDLLSHRSGLPAYVADTMTELLWSEADILEALPKIPLEGTFQKTYGYQNIFVGICGRVIEKATGQPLSVVYKTYIFDPLRMSETSIGHNGLTGGEGWWAQLLAYCCSWWANFFGDKVTLHHHSENGEALPMPYGNPAINTFSSSRGIYSTIEDMAKWLAFQVCAGEFESRQYISEAQISQTRLSHVAIGESKSGTLFPLERVNHIDYGMGWFIHDYAGAKMLTHFGGMTGVRSLIAVIPDERVGIIMLSNLGGLRVSYALEALRSRFFDLYLGLPDQDWSKLLRQGMINYRKEAEKRRARSIAQRPEPSAQHRVYAGQYTHPLYGVLTIQEEKNDLVLIYRTLRCKLSHVNGHTFSFVGSDLSPGLSGVDVGDVIFKDPEVNGKSEALIVSLLREGATPFFTRVKS